MITVEDWAEIRRLHRSEGISQAGIARMLGISRNTVAKALASDRPPKYERAPAGSVVDAVEPRIRLLLAQFPTMPATVIAERIGWTRSLTVLKDRVRELRPLFAGVDPTDRVEYDPGEVAQCDLWFPPVAIPVGGGQERILPVLAMTCGYSRITDAMMIPSRKAGDILAGMWETATGWGASPRTLVWDREAAIGGSGKLTAEAAGFAGTLAGADGHDPRRGGGHVDEPADHQRVDAVVVARRTHVVVTSQPGASPQTDNGSDRRQGHHHGQVGVEHFDRAGADHA